MFNPNTIYVSNSESSFVGLRRNNKSNTIEFCVPIGFENFPKNFDETKSLFKNTYRTLRKYISNRKRNIQTSNFDGFIEETEKGISIKTTVESDISLQYFKLIYFDSILDAYDDLSILAIQNKIGRTESIDYSQIHRFLHKAIYLNNDVIYVDEMDAPRNVIQSSITDLLELFGYIYTEILAFLDESIENHQLLGLANNFRQNYLSTDSSLFDERSLSETTNILRDRLLEIESHTAYKDQDFWHFFDAIEIFLYGELDDESEGNILWGVDKFSVIWEELCFAYAESTFGEEILFADRSGGSENDKSANRIYRYKNFEPPGIFINPNFRSPFHFELNSIYEKRYIRPDLVVESPDSIYDEFEDLVNGRYRNKILKLKNPSYKPYHRKLCNTLSYNQLLDEDEKTFFKKSYSLNQIYIKENELEKFLPLLKEAERKILDQEILVIDYKYLPKSIFESPGLLALKTKIVPDITKQIIYELALQLNLESKTRSEFWIPTYSSFNNLKSALPLESLCQEIRNASIFVCTLNFVELEKIYLDS